MRLLWCLLLFFPFLVQAQTRFVAPDYSKFYQWFHQEAQVDALYGQNSQLYTFSSRTPIRKSPDLQSEVIGILAAGQPVFNIGYPMDVSFIPQSEQNGYLDNWYKVRVYTSQGKAQTAYIWGGHLAKGWRHFDIDRDGIRELILLGLSSEVRRDPTDLQGELKILKNGQMISQRQIPGLCLFEECASSPLLRVTAIPEQAGSFLIEASTMTIGCEVGIDRAFFVWQDTQLHCVYYGEFTTKKTYIKQDYLFHTENGVFRCSFSHIDTDFNPVIQVQPYRPEAAPVRAALPKVRAR